MPHEIGILIFPNFQLLDATGPAAVFDVANQLKGGYDYKITMLSAQGGLIASSSGVTVATAALKDVPYIDTLMTVGGMGTRQAAADPLVTNYVQSQAPQCRRLASVCTGTFILAQAGVVNGLRVTTHWRQSALLAEMFPDVKVEANKIWVRDGKVWSSAGVTAGIDLALALVAEDCGEEIARQTAREIVVYYKRPGGQSQFSTIEELGGRDNRFKPVLAWIRENISQPIKVENLAEVAAMSPRNFSRQFQKSIGRTPAKAVEQIRVEEARNLVESTDLSVEKIAERCGFSDSEIMRRAFVRLFGRAPRAMRDSRV
jgi:transcriptional regulator GlxA family with amidase domain